MQIYRFDGTIGSARRRFGNDPRTLLPREIIDIHRTSEIPSWFRESRDSRIPELHTHTHIHPPAAEFKRLTGAVSRE